MTHRRGARACAAVTPQPQRLRMLAAAVIVAVPVLAGISPRAAAGDPGDASFLQVSIDRVTPDMITTAGRCRRHRQRDRDQRRRPAGARRHGPAGAGRGGHVPAGSAHESRRRHRRVPPRRRLHPAGSVLQRGQSGTFTFSFPRAVDVRAVAGHRAARACIPCSSTPTARPTTASRPASTTAASCCRFSACPLDASVRCCRRADQRRGARHRQAHRRHDVVAVGRPAAAGRPVHRAG